jgi:phospholipase/carboxylesterase
MMLDFELIPATNGQTGRLMVMLHGLGDSIEGYRWLPEAMNLPWLGYALVNAPDDYYGGFSWYDFDGDMRPGVKRSRKLLENLLEQLEGRGYRSEQTTLAGFSQGCVMALEVGLHQPRRFAGIVGISGYVYEPEELVRELTPAAHLQRLLVTHGTNDPLLPIGKVRGQVQMLKHAGLNIQWREFAKAHTIAGDAELTVIRDFVRAGYSDFAPN